MLCWLPIFWHSYYAERSNADWCIPVALFLIFLRIMLIYGILKRFMCHIYEGAINIHHHHKYEYKLNEHSSCSKLFQLIFKPIPIQSYAQSNCPHLIIILGTQMSLSSKYLQGLDSVFPGVKEDTLLPSFSTLNAS